MDHGGLDAMIYLCNMVHGYELHSLATSALAALAEHRMFFSCLCIVQSFKKKGGQVSEFVNTVQKPCKYPFS
jgi:hypothetical protein